jgi:glutathione S-transferase
MRRLAASAALVLLASVHTRAADDPLARARLLYNQGQFEAAINAAMPQAHTVFTELARLLGEQPYFAGATVSLADLLIAPQLAFLTQTPEWSVLGAPHKNLVAWLARMEARPSFAATTWQRVSEMAQAA